MSRALTEKEIEALTHMVGTEGIKDLEALCRLLPKDHGFANPHSLAIHFIQMSIEGAKDNFQSYALGLQTNVKEESRKESK